MSCSKFSDSKFSFQELISSKRESYLVECKLKEINHEIAMALRDLKHFKEFSQNPLQNEEYREEIKQKISICQNNLSSHLMMKSNLFDKIKRTAEIFSKFCGFLKNQYGYLEKIYIPEGMEFDSTGLREVYTSDAGTFIFEMIDPPSIDPANFFSEESATEVVSPPEKTAEVVVSKEPAEVVSPLEKTAEVVVSKEPADPEETFEKDPLPEKVPKITFASIVTSSVVPSPSKEVKKVTEKELSSLFKLDSPRRPIDEKCLAIHTKFMNYLKNTIQHFFENIVTESYRPTRNLVNDLKFLIKSDEITAFKNACCYYTNESALKFWKNKCNICPPLLMIKKDLSLLLKENRYYLVTNSIKDGNWNTFLCAEESENLPKGAKATNGTM